jgi:eukaryotic-like serine/threonine-protein kinase
MGHTAATAQVFRFGLFEADAGRNTLSRSGSRVKIQDQPFRVLLLLLERPGEIVSREELQQKLWPEGTYVDFDGSLNVTLKKLRASLDDDSDNPRFIETVPRRGYRFIAPVAVTGMKAESAVPADVVAVESQTGTGEVATTRAASILKRPQSQVVTYCVSAALVLLLVVSISWYRRSHLVNGSPSAQPVSTASLPLRKSIAVLGFHNMSGRAEDGWLATAFSEMLSTELASGEKLRLVSGEDVANLRLSSPWSQTDTLGQETTARIGTALNSDLLVLGSYTNIGAADRRQLRLDVRLQDARTGEILTEVAESGSGQDLFRITSRIGARLRERVGVPGLAENEEAGVLASLPLDRQGARLYSLGLIKLHEFDALAAKDLLQQASAADPKFPLVHAMLARAWHQLGYEQKRKEEAKKALDLSVDLPRAERMLVEGDYYESLADHEKAASTYRALFELFPDSVEYGLQLAATQVAAGHESQALATLAQLRRLPSPASDDPRIDLVEARAISDKKPASLVLVRSAIRKATSQGKRLIYAQARREECLDLLYGEHPEQAIASCEEAYNISLAAGNRLGAADAVRLMADYQGSVGHMEQAIAIYQRALNVLQQLGEHEKTGIVLNNMAIAFANEGKLDRAEQLYREAKAHFEQTGDKRNVATALANIADMLYLRGKLSAAAKVYEQSMALEASMDHGDPSYVLYRLADLQLAQGRVKDAHRLAQQAVDLLRPAQSGYRYLTTAMLILGDALQAEGDLQAARQQYQAAFDIRQKIGEMDLVAESQVSLAELALEEAHPEQAELLLRPAIAEFEKEKADPAATSAYTLLSRTLLAENKVEEARKAIQHATELAHGSPDPALNLPTATQHARVEIASAGHGPGGNIALAAARRELRSVVATAKKLGYYDFECEARLALGELELKADPAWGRSRLKELAGDAGERGLQLISRKATLLAAGTNVIAAESR